MAKSTALNFTQNLNNASVMFNSSDVYSVIQVAPTSNGTTLTPGTRTFTAAGGTQVSGAANSAAQWTMTAVGAAGAAAVSGPPIITQMGVYTPGNGPTATANAATVDSGTTNATFAVTSGIMKLLYTGSANDAVVKAINVASTDSAARTVTLWEQDASGGQFNLVCAVNVPLTSGGASGGAVAAVDLLGGTLLPSLPYDTNGKRVLPVKAGVKLYVSVPAVTASTFISVSAMIEEY